MTDNFNWQNTAILGAAGKMGRGISLLILQEIADVDSAHLTLQDCNIQAFDSLRQYLRDHLTKVAERNINHLRRKYAQRVDLVDNGEMIREYVMQAMDRVRCVEALEECHGANLVFEAIVEDVAVKAEVFSKLDAYAGPEAYYFSNTSSIPLSVLQQKSNLGRRLIGFHFYNPPSVQKLLEIIVPEHIDPLLREKAVQLAKKLKKTIVFSKDVAGFIGNGHFIREIVEACKKVRELSKEMAWSEAIVAVNRLTQEFLLRPMGIFQLIDYVGIDVCQRIAKIMTDYLHIPLSDPLIDNMVSNGILGGQNPDGSQKPGFLSYQKGQPISVYDLKERRYGPYQESLLGSLPASYIPWKNLSKDPNRQEKIEAYFLALGQEKTVGAKLGREFLKNSLMIAEGLVKDGVAKSIGDVDTVLQQGFYHLYGVAAPFVVLENVGGKR